jgi:Fe-S oxidoreductase
VGHVTARETLTPHAWALTIESVRRGQLTWNDETAAVMFACADCGLCQAHCVTDQPLPDAIAAARADIVRQGHAPAAVIDVARQRQSVPAATAFPRAARALFAGAAGGGDALVEASAAARLLEAAGVSASVAGQGWSTGSTASSLGLMDEAIREARALVDAVQAAGIRELLVLRPEDRWTFESVYPTRLGVTWPADVAVIEVSTVLADAHAGGALPIAHRAGLTAAYHDPCHAPRLPDGRTGPRRLLAAVLGAAPVRELFWRADRAHPCGAVGGLAVTHPEIARRLTAARLDAAALTGAALLVTEDPVCLAELRRHAAPPLEVAGLFSLVAAQLGA